MSFLMVCPPCYLGRCEDHVPHGGPDGIIGGVSCPCRHSDEEKRRHREDRERALRSLGLDR